MVCRISNLVMYNCKIMMVFFFLVHYLVLQRTWVLIMGLWGMIQNRIGVEELMEGNGGAVRTQCLIRSTVNATCIEVVIVQESLWKNHLKLTLLWQQSLVATCLMPNQPQAQNLQFQVQTMWPFMNHLPPNQVLSIPLLLTAGREMSLVPLIIKPPFLLLLHQRWLLSAAWHLLLHITEVTLMCTTRKMSRTVVVSATRSVFTVVGKEALCVIVMVSQLELASPQGVFFKV